MRTIDRAEYQQRLQGMWLAQAIANWTGIRTEGARSSPPFFTDADWGTQPPGLPQPIIFVLNQNPWWADDDTDIEAVYLHLLHPPDGPLRTHLDAATIADGWRTHINNFIWVSNARARQLMSAGLEPPSTGLIVTNEWSNRIDAQLTTEFFGAMTPGMPGRGLALADLPIAATASMFATHAAQFHVVLYALASRIDRSLPGRDQAVWLVEQARAFLPDSSKSADAVDFVLAHFLANPDADDWESTRDAIYVRYQLEADQNGFVYRGVTESTVNFATGVMALLYGQMDLRRTIQIGTLSGWDSDNPTATMGALLGLVLGHEGVVQQFPEAATLSDRFWISRTRDAMPDYLPADPQAEDTFALMAARMIDITEAIILEEGGLIDAGAGRWLLPPAYPPGERLAASPTRDLHLRSANNQVPVQGGSVAAVASASGSPPAGRGHWSPVFVANGIELDYSGRDLTTGRNYWSCQNAGLAPGQTITLAVTSTLPVTLHTIRFIEGGHAHAATDPFGYDGGWFTSLSWEARIGGLWTPVQTTPSDTLDPDRPFQVIDFALDQPVTATGVRLTGAVGGTGAFATVTEIDMLSPPSLPARPSFDLLASGAIDIEDLYEWHRSPADLDGSADAADTDRRYLQHAVRWAETHTSTTPP